MSSDGISQGDVLIPTVFLPYTASLFGLDAENATLFQFADDVSVVAWGRSMTEVTSNL